MARVFVGNLPEDVRERELSDKFERFGRLMSVRIKFPARPPPFAFLTYDSEQDASDAVRSMNNSMYAGSRIRVEMSRGIDDARPRGTHYRVKITGLPDTMSWQDLKDFLRKGGDVVHSDVDRRGNGSASFATQDEIGCQGTFSISLTLPFAVSSPTFESQTFAFSLLFAISTSLQQPKQPP
ncbi:hypothetical protein JG687_00011362 [Phytophthora cactorum]|uniref:RRM domain-containing protein n=1 Tax=Phytophthora cactorum TaxID=29920 RepID=A0A8T1U4V2_9STRA|nr:hypothetical protein JG687_00011362 [Phytophthora cactorum]